MCGVVRDFWLGISSGRRFSWYVCENTTKFDSKLSEKNLPSLFLILLICSLFYAIELEQGRWTKWIHIKTKTLARPRWPKRLEKLWENAISKKSPRKNVEIEPRNHWILLKSMKFLLSVHRIIIQWLKTPSKVM